MGNEMEASGIASQLKSLFWDADWGSLNLGRHKKYIIERALEFGNEAVYRWLFSVYGDEDIISVVRTSRRISRATAVMMANFYRLPEAEVRCLRTACDQKPWSY